MDRHLICLSFKHLHDFISFHGFSIGFFHCSHGVVYFFLFFYFITVDMPQHDLHRTQNNAIVSTSNIVCLVIRIMLVRGEIWANKTSLTPPFVIEVPIPCQARNYHISYFGCSLILVYLAPRMNICVRGINIASDFKMFLLYFVRCVIFKKKLFHILDI
jgi:hypothetical protein